MNNSSIDTLTNINRPSRRVTLLFSWVVGIACVFPFLLNLLGVDFSSQKVPLPEGIDTQAIDDYFYFLTGSFTHTILEWTAVTIACCVALLALVHYKIVRDETTLVIGIALFAAGCMDAFHTLAADRLIEAVVDNRQLIPFTWAIARVFEAAILMFGVGFYLIIKKSEGKQGLKTAIFISVAIVATAYGIIHYCSTSAFLPKTLYPDSIVTRPWDVAPLVMFILAGLFLFPRYYREHPTLFGLSLMISLIPNIILEIHMAFGSSALFDNHFNIAHFLKIIAYFVPFVGMVMDYGFSHERQQQTLKDLTKSRAQSQAILDNAVDGIISINSVGIISSVNPKARELFGYDAAELIGQNVKMLMPDPYGSEHDSYLSNHMRTGEKKIIGIDREVEGKRKNGSVFPMDLTVTEVKGLDVRQFTGFVRDISERKKFESELKEREELFSAFVNSAPTLMWMTDENHQPVIFNNKWLQFFGTTLEQEINFHWGCYDRVHPGSLKQVMQIHEEGLKQREPFDHEYQLRDKDGNYSWFWERGVPRFNNGKYQGFIGNLVNITDRKHMEEELQTSLEQLTKSNTELEQFAYIASHDLQEPLRMVASYTQLLSRRYKGKLDDDADEFIAYAVDGAKRMQGLIQDLLEYSRVGNSSKELIPVSSDLVLKNTIANLEAAIDEAGIVVSHDEMPMVIADDIQLMQLLQNLIGNAIKYRDPEKLGEIQISAEARGKQWVFSIKDNGIGIEPKFFERIFVVFKRLHTAVEKSGTGIGLSVCKKIVERHGGEIWVESEPGEGSVFMFTLQAAEEVIPEIV